MDWATPRYVVDHVDREFHFVLDACAVKKSSVTPDYFGPDHENPARRDCLTADWGYAARAALGRMRGLQEGTGREIEVSEFYKMTHRPPAVWMNPPYGRGIGDFMVKARNAALAEGVTVVALTFARVETAWWTRNVPGFASEVRFLGSRLKFLDPETMKPRLDKKGNPQGATAPSSLIIWHPWSPPMGHTVHTYIQIPSGCE